MAGRVGPSATPAVVVHNTNPDPAAFAAATAPALVPATAVVAVPAGPGAAEQALQTQQHYSAP